MFDTWYLIFVVINLGFTLPTYFYTENGFLRMSIMNTILLLSQQRLLKTLSIGLKEFYKVFLFYLLKGPFGHFFASTFFPMHPVAISVFGVLTGFYAMAAHDGRMMDINGHTKHHYYKECNFVIYFFFNYKGLYGIWDRILGTRYKKENFKTYIPSWEREKTK